jgi:hypothetical protein
MKVAEPKLALNNVAEVFKELLAALLCTAGTKEGWRLTAIHRPCTEGDKDHMSQLKTKNQKHKTAPHSPTPHQFL